MFTHTCSFSVIVSENSVKKEQISCFVCFESTRVLNQQQVELQHQVLILYLSKVIDYRL